MRMKSIAALAALALAFTAGAASAASPFTALDGITAVPLTAAEMDAVRGTGIEGTPAIGTIEVFAGTGIIVFNEHPDDDGIPPPLVRIQLPTA